MFSYNKRVLITMIYIKAILREHRRTLRNHRRRTKHLRPHLARRHRGTVQEQNDPVVGVFRPEDVPMDRLLGAGHREALAASDGATEGPESGSDPLTQRNGFRVPTPSTASREEG